MALTRSARRWIVAGAAVGVVVAALGGAEGVARAAIQSRLDQAAPAGVHISPSGSAAWGLVTGSLAVSLTVDESVIAAAVQDRADDIWIDDRIHVTVSRSTPLGDIPVEVALTPTVAGGELTMEVVEVSAGGIALSPDVIDMGFPLDQTLIDSNCLELHDASVQEGHLLLHGEVPTGLGGAQGC